MAGAGRGLEKSGIGPVKVLDFEDLAGRVGAVLSEATVDGDTVEVGLQDLCKSRKDGNIRIGSSYVLTHEELTATAVEALLAELTVVGSNTVANLEALGFLFLVSISMMSGIVWN